MPYSFCSRFAGAIKQKSVNEMIFAKNGDSSLSHVIGSVNGWINIL